MNKLKVGIVGLSRGSSLVRALAAHDKLEIAGLCDLNADRLADIGQEFNLPDTQLFTDYAQFVESDLNIVTVATPIEYHAQHSIMAMEAGKDVLSEQTAAYTIADCQRLVATQRRTQQIYMMAENYCYYNYIRQWQALIDQGKLGTIYYAEAEYIHEIKRLLVDPSTGQRQWRYTRAPIWYCGHTLGPLLKLMDDRIVKATGSQTGHHTHPGESVAYIDMEVGLFQTQKGAVIKILRSQIAPRYPELVWYSLYGTKGMVESGRSGGWGATKGMLFVKDEMDEASGAQTIECSTSDPNAPPEARASSHGTSEFFMVRDFVDAIEHRTKPPIDVVRACDFTIPGIVAHEAAMAGGTWLDVPLME